MITRRQFLIGISAMAASALLPLGTGCQRKPAQAGISSEEQKEIPLFIPDCDWIIDGAVIIDGSGGSAMQGRIAVKGDKIVAVGDFQINEKASLIDAQGLVVTPGFIDIHTHTEDYILAGESMAPFLSQGVTTQVGGNCGRSPRDIKGYFRQLPATKINYGLFIGYRTLRELAGVSGSKKASADDIITMQGHLAQAMADGALGLSTGLEYAPQHLATEEELISLCRVLRDYGGFYSTHIRNEYGEVVQALDEAIRIGLAAEVPVQYSHIKAGYPENWDKTEVLLAMLADANRKGLDITADVYPYTFSSTDLGKKPLIHSISEQGMEAAAADPFVFFGSDTGIYSGGRATHPRAYGTFPRVLAMLVRDKKVISLETAVAKMTSMPARRLRLADRGLLKAGCKADIVLLDPAKVRDRATQDSPMLLSEGINKVWINGRLAWEEGSTRTVAGEKIR